MPKINVYLPDDLAEAVKQSGVPVSAVCQRALEQAVRRVTAIREAVLADHDDGPVGALAHFSPRTRTVLKLAAERARDAGAPRMGTEHVLGAMLEEGTNLALHVLRAMEVEPKHVARELSGRQSDVPATAPPDSDPRRLDGPAANALELAVTEATALGHHYIGCEHLLLGLAVEPDGVAGQVLRALGADPKPVRRAITAALAGYVHLRAEAGQGQPTAASAGAPPELAGVLRAELEPLARRIARLEEHLGLALEG
ncbi:Clp protease N-terminal domain-containing protein [Streptomyces hoynatensis]|uniref:ATP-dependent Clp protease ATP-binding subunit n=1 Tax=Streptomyces hoynatensis TaxID=1141874 RepID=A0A3A9YVK2_9ACTN|nr:Clp protease N-terminal domain-containing protein [Streptomyces hoynatensis]RKN40072.1 ATP-dependent Clp protease ATP-binding subunit [Streptomyces hoynatensis]